MARLWREIGGTVTAFNRKQSGSMFVLCFCKMSCSNRFENYGPTLRNQLMYHTWAGVCGLWFKIRFWNVPARPIYERRNHSNNVFEAGSHNENLGILSK